jgi:Uma2 family endonuclease
MTMTLERWAALPDTPENRRLECVDGEVVMAPPPLGRHQVACVDVLNALAVAMPPHLRAILSQDIVLRHEPLLIRQPDVLVVPRDHSLQVNSVPLELVSLVVEVLSPSSRRTDLVDKRREYAEAGIPACWIVDLDTPSLTVFRLAGTTYERVAEHTSAADVESCGVTVPVDVPTLGT